MTTHQYILQLERRRRDLGMSIAALAKRCGVSKPTVQRVLSGKHGSTSFEHVVAISGALGMVINVTPETSALEFQKANALEKAKQLIGAVQGSSALEGQAVSAEKLNELIERTTCTLLAGSHRRLWT